MPDQKQVLNPMQAIQKYHEQQDERISRGIYEAQGFSDFLDENNFAVAYHLKDANTYLTEFMKAQGRAKEKAQRASEDEMVDVDQAIYLYHREQEQRIKANLPAEKMLEFLNRTDRYILHKSSETAEGLSRVDEAESRYANKPKDRGSFHLKKRNHVILAEDDKFYGQNCVNCHWAEWTTTPSVEGSPSLMIQKGFCVFEPETPDTGKMPDHIKRRLSRKSRGMAICAKSPQIGCGGYLERTHGQKFFKDDILRSVDLPEFEGGRK